MPLLVQGSKVEEHGVQDFGPDLAYDVSPKGGVVFLDMDQAQPTVKGYAALNQPQPYLGVISAPEYPLGSILAYFSDGSTQVVFGGPSHLWRIGADDGFFAWQQADIGGFSTLYKWVFTQFGDDVIAVNPGLAEPLVAHGAGGPFAPLAGGPPGFATTALTVNAQVFMFAGQNWYVSALLTDDNWTPDVQTQAGSGSIYDFPGPIVAAAPLFRNVVLFKKTATWLGTYVGGYPVWSWQLIADFTGTWTQGAVIPMPDSVAFLGTDDFYLCSGYTPQRIPNSLKEWFFNLADPNFLGYTLSRFDPIHSVCYWYFVTKATPLKSVPDRYVAWNSRTGRWASGYIQALDVPSPNFQPNFFSGLYFDVNWTLNSWTGVPSVMMLTTSYFGTPQTHSQCMRFKPIYYVAPQVASIIPYHTTTLGNPDVVGPTAILNPKDGWYYFRQYDRWHKFQINLAGPGVIQPNVATGAEISAVALELRPAGWR